MNVGLVSNAIFPESLLAQIHHLLRGTSAFDGHDGDCEVCLASLEVLPESAHLLSQWQYIHGASWAVWIKESWKTSFDLFPSELKPRRYDKIIIGKFSVFVGHDPIVLWIQGHHALVDEVKLGVEHVGHLHHCVLVDHLLVPRASADVRETRLVVMIWLSVKHSDLLGFQLAGPDERRGQLGASTAATDDGEASVS